MKLFQIKTIAIIAEGIPENMTRKLILTAKQKGVSIIGPATVGGIKPGCFKIGNTGGMMDNILHSKLYRPGRYTQTHILNKHILLYLHDVCYPAWLTSQDLAACPTN